MASLSKQKKSYPSKKREKIEDSILNHIKNIDCIIFIH